MKGRGWKRWWIDILLLLGLALLPALFFWRILGFSPEDTVTIPPGDFTDLHYPYRAFVAREISQGRLPLWNPYILSGQSAIGDIQFGIFYPVGLLFIFLFRPLTVLALEGQIIFHFSLAGIFTYLFVRHEVGSRLGALAAALIFAYGGYLTSFPVQQMIILETSVWLPLALLFISLSLDKGRIAYLILAGLSLASAALVGHPQTFAYVVIASEAYLIFRLWQSGRKAGLLWSGPALLLLVAAGAAALQLWPSYQHLQLTARTEVGPEFAGTGFSPHELLGLLVPSQLGGKPLYSGILPLALVGAALVSRNAGRLSWFWLGMGVAALLLSMGNNTFLYDLVYLTPGFGLFRNHERLSFLVSFSVAVMAGYGAKALVGDRGQTLAAYGRWLGWALIPLALVTALFVAAYVSASGVGREAARELMSRSTFTLLLAIMAVASVYTRLKGYAALSAFAILAIGLIALDLFTTNGSNNRYKTRPEDLLSPTSTVAFLSQSQGELYRVASEGLLPGDGNAGSLFALYDVVGNSPIETKAYATFNKEVEEWQRWRLLNVLYIVTKRKLNDGRLNLVHQEKDINTYEILPPHRFPRAYVTHKAVVARDEVEALELTKKMDVGKEAILLEQPPYQMPADPADAEETVDITEYLSQRITLEASLATNGILVLSEVYYPGWVARVDGEEVEILKTDYLLRGVSLPKGQHKIELVYEPPPFRQGLWVSLFIMALSATIITYNALRARL